ncbi:MAG: ribokinase [Candidatus Lokiarchaeota archaeon]|nr:ribokinase [Candidatus Lokiarchaeota archaeon]
MRYVVVVGSSNVDMNIYSERLPKPGETVTGGTFKRFLGGKGANQAVAAARAGASTFFLGKVGTDLFGDEILKRLEQAQIDVKHVARSQTEATGIAFILVDKFGENMISVAPGANATLSKEQVLKSADLIEKARVVMTQMEIPLETIENIYAIAEKGNTIKILNPAPLRNVSRDILKRVDIIIPNEGELFKLNALMDFSDVNLGNIEHVVQASSNIASIGTKYIITTLGSKGSVLYEKRTGHALHIPALKANAIDTVGAGDCYNGVLASKLCEGKDVLTAVKYATAAASIAVTRKGAQESMPYQDEIKIKFKEIENIEPEKLN